jgi:hypothetical protein
LPSRSLTKATFPLAPEELAVGATTGARTKHINDTITSECLIGSYHRLARR